MSVVQGALHTAEGRVGRVDWTLAEESPVAVIINAEPFAVMMATPADLEDFALGFCLSEGLIEAPNALLLTRVTRLDAGWELCLAVDPERADSERLAGRRGLEGRTGCGLCGVETLAQAVPPPAQVQAAAAAIAPRAIARAFAALPDHQPLNASTRSVHAAALCGPAGDILMAREDVGRHNALDKLIGGAIRGGLSPAQGFVILSSRCSVELVHKTARVGVPLLATISAPTTLALETAGRAGMTLAAHVRPDGVALFPPAPVGA